MFVVDKRTYFNVGDEVILHPALDQEDYAELKDYEGLDPEKRYRVIKTQEIAGYQQIAIDNGIKQVLLISGWFIKAPPRNS